ncbi:hypothetical protein ACLB1R_12500 [Escherichia coli]
MNQVNESHSRASDIWREVASLVSPTWPVTSSGSHQALYAGTTGSQHFRSVESSLTPYMIDPINTLSAREYDAVVFVGPAWTG